MGDKIENLLEEIEHKELVLPEFQREFTWKQKQVRKLFESLFRNWPTGSLLVWVTENPPKIKNDAYDLEKVRRVKVLLDGQQRLTSLYLHVCGEVPPYYSPDEISDGYFDLYFNVKTGEFKYYNRKEMENDPLWMKLADLFNSTPSIYRLVDSVGVEDSEEREALFQAIESNITCLKGILKQEYPVQAVPSDATLRKAIKVFDLINSQGTPLSQADIALAYMTAEWPDIRRKFKDKIDQLKKENFSFDLTFMTRCMVGVLSGVGELKRFGDTTEAELKQAWGQLDRVLEYLVSFLRGKAYIIGTGDLNTTNALVPLVVYLARHGWFTHADESRFLYWMYGALFQRRYSGSVETALDRDVTTLLQSPEPETLIANLKEDDGEPVIMASNLDMRGVGHPLYNMMSIVIRANGAVDWANGLPLVKNAGSNFRIERHHIFPTSVLVRAGWDTGNSQYHKKRVHEIANRIPLTQEGNMDIFNLPPAEYLPIVEQRYPGTLRCSLIPENPNLWQVEHYEAFLERRRQLIADAINDFMASLLEGRSKADLSLAELVQQGETGRLEFKARLRGGSKDGHYHLEMAVAKAVAGMLNAKGGIVLIGVGDDGSIVGLEADYATLGKKNRDGFEIHLMNVLKSKLGTNVLPLIQTHFESIDGHDVCGVEVDPSSRPVYLQDGNEQQFYVRVQNSTRPFSLEEATTYIQDHSS